MAIYCEIASHSAYDLTVLFVLLPYCHLSFPHLGFRRGIFVLIAPFPEKYD